MQELTLDILKTIAAGEIFAHGEGLFPILSQQNEVRWIAVKGGGHDDWAIYYHLIRHTPDFIRKNGDKCVFDDTIRMLVPCTDEVLALYRK